MKGGKAMIKTIRVMIIPNNKQGTRLFQFAGTARFAYNWALEEEKKNYEAGGKFLSDNELRKRFTQFKQEPKNLWLYTISNNVCKQAIKDAVNAYKKFFDKLAQFPRYKSRRRNRPSFYVDTSKIQVTKTHVKLENIALSKRRTRQTANWFRLAEPERIPLNAKYFNPRISFDGLNWFLTLGIETSCDETSASVVKNGREILSNIIDSQIPIHEKYGGVVPEIASRNHIEAINRVTKQAIQEAGINFKDIDVIAPTYGPGLVGALLVGLSYGKALSFALNKPLVGVDHIQGHIAANYITYKELEPPFICVLISGGNTEIIHVKNYTQFEVLGKTRDDAIGEVFDKIARAIGLRISRWTKN